MLGVPPRKIKSNMQYQSIWSRLEKLVPWILGSYIPIKKSNSWGELGWNLGLCTFIVNY